MSKINKVKPALIFGDSISAFGVIRGLRSSGIPIYIVSKDGKGLALKSKYVKGSIILDHRSEDFINDLNAWCLQEVGEEAVLLVGGDDHYLQQLAKSKDQLLPGMKCTFPDWNILKKVTQKRLCYDIADKLNIPIPKTFYITSRTELLDVLENKKEEFSFPVFLKAEDSRSLLATYGIKGVVCNNSVEVKESYDRYGGFGGELLLQELILGDTDKLIAVLISANRNGDPTGLIINEKVRAEGPYLSSALSSSCWNEELLQYALKLVKEIKYCGYAGVQFTYDERDSTYKLLEINGRFSLSNSLALRCGVNLALQIYREAIEGPLPPLKELKQTYKNKILWWNILGDTHAIKNYKLYKNPFQYIKSILGRGYIIEPFSLRDIRPSLYHFRNYCRTFMSFMLKGRNSKR